jgi:hypothetical protein
VVGGAMLMWTIGPSGTHSSYNHSLNGDSDGHANSFLL